MADHSSSAHRWPLRVIAVGYVGMLVTVPVVLILKNALADGITQPLRMFADPVVLHAFRMTLIVAAAAVLANLLFGVGISLLLVRHRFPGKRLLSAVLDLPLSVSPVVVGLALILVYGSSSGWLGSALQRIGIQIIFATPGMVLATTFVSLPLVIRELVPVLRELGDDQEQAARSLGASGWQTFRRITLPSIRWAVIYGLVLSLARSLGEFGAVKVVSGNLSGQTQTATLLVEQQYQNFQQADAYTTAAVLALASIVCLVTVSVIRSKENHR